MLKEKPCRCGVSKKRFKMDIGAFFIGECCEARGYDVHGKMKGQPAPAPENPHPNTALPESAPVLMSNPPQEPPKPAPVLSQKPGKNRLLDMRLGDLKTIAAGRGAVVAEDATKKELVEAILGTFP